MPNKWAREIEPVLHPVHHTFRGYRMLRSLVLLVVMILGFGGFSVFAATPYKRTLSVKSNTYMKDGVFIGGKAGEGSSLLGVRRAYSDKAKIERVIVDLGDHQARPAGRSPGYFQVSMDSVNNRVVVDLAQLRLSKVSEAQLQNIFRKSPYISSASLTLDPEDKAGTMVFKLKRPMRLEVFQLLDKRKPGRVVIDLTPMGAAPSRASSTSQRSSAARESFLPASRMSSQKDGINKRKAVSRAPKRSSKRGEAFE